ncbi:hypothetical protein HYC85_014384 [Camellia sinensis]|uniref:Uncharacterized protein n=1 Tax=Camellia sinensis TaxID=4442 RepID=A0A7J7H7A1_CAMSI|nr:hypothetical protein HYC85_014384 [Camellia sinensis]
MFHNFIKVVPSHYQPHYNPHPLYYYRKVGAPISTTLIGQKRRRQDSMSLATSSINYEKHYEF